MHHSLGFRRVSLGLNIPALITQSRLRARWVIGCAGDGWGEGERLACKFQSRLRYPSGALADSQNQFGEGGLASTFFLCLLASVAPHMHTPLFITSSPVHPFNLLSLPLSICFPLSPPFYLPLSSPCACHRPLINTYSYLVGGSPVIKAISEKCRSYTRHGRLIRFMKTLTEI